MIVQTKVEIDGVEYDAAISGRMTPYRRATHLDPEEGGEIEDVVLVLTLVGDEVRTLLGDRQYEAIEIQLAEEIRADDEGERAYRAYDEWKDRIGGLP